MRITKDPTEVDKVELDRSSMDFAPYSYSRLSVHKQCPRKFHYTYVMKLPKKPGDITPLLKGGAVHSILENHPEKSSHKLAPKYIHIADNFLRTRLGKRYLSESSIREFSFGLLSNFTPTEYSDKKAVFRGSVDYICVIDGRLHLIDWKTGKLKEEKWQDFDQLMFYAVYFFHRYPNVDEIKISYVYVEHEDHENSITLHRDFLPSYRGQLKAQILETELDSEYPKSKGPLCNYCDFQEHCDSTPDNPGSMDLV